MSISAGQSSILATGANGQVGWELARRCRARNLPVVALSRDELDITDGAAVVAAFERHRPPLVINAAAYTAVDRAEDQPDLAFAVNRDAVQRLARACLDRAIPLFHLSTDYVFAGEREGAYQEDDAVSPLGVYGQSKWQGEAVLRDTLPQHLIIRVSWVFGAHGHNFVKTMLGLGTDRDELRIVDDQRGCPTPATDIADVLLELAERHLNGQDLAWGTYHYCGMPATTWYGFAAAIFEQAAEEGLPVPGRIVPITTAEYPTPAARPANSVLDCARIETQLGIRRRPWQDSLTGVVAEWAKARTDAA